MQPVGGIPGVVRPGCVVEVNEVEPKSGALLGEIRKLSNLMEVETSGVYSHLND